MIKSSSYAAFALLKMLEQCILCRDDAWKGLDYRLPPVTVVDFFHQIKVRHPERSKQAALHKHIVLLYKSASTNLKSA